MQAILEWYNARKKSSKRVQVRRRVMSMYARELGTIPEETVRVAHAACPKGTLAMRLRDALGELYQDEQFAALYPVEGQPAYEPWRLAVVTVLQYAENLTDRQAADAVRERIDWKYSLGLDLTDPGFDFSLLSEFRLRLVEAGAETLLLDRLLEVCKQRGWLKAGGKQGTDCTHVLSALEQPEAPAELADVASVHLLRQVWQQYYDLSGGKAKWRAGPQAGADEGIIRSPYDPEARTGKKRETTWFGYKVHLTETCALETTEDAQVGAMPQLIVEVQTTVANVQDVDMTEVIEEDLAQHHLTPDEQIVDTGYVDADLLVKSQEHYGIKLLGPVLSDNSWQAKAGKGFDVAHFQIDWHNRQATCPQGQTSARWSPAGERMEVVFAREVCAACPRRSDCTKSSTTGRVLHVRPQAAHEALQQRRHEQETPAFRQAYQTRAGIEGTLSQAVRGMGIRRAR